MKIRYLLALVMVSLPLSSCDGFEFPNIFEIFSCECLCECAELYTDRTGPTGGGVSLRCINTGGLTCSQACLSQSLGGTVLCQEH